LENKPLTYAAIIIAAVAIAVALKFMAPVMVPFVTALFFYYILAPVKDFLNVRLALPHVLAVVGSLLAGILVIGAFFLFVYATVDTIAGNWESLEAGVREKMDQDLRGGEIEGWLHRMGIDLDEILGRPREDGREPEAAPADPAVAPEAVEGGAPGEPAAERDTAASLEPATPKAWGGLDVTRVRRIVAASANQFVNLVVNMVLVLIFLGYLLSAKTKSLSPLLGEVKTTVNRYLVLKVLVSLVTGLLTWGILAVLGLRFSFVFGFLAFAFNFIPSVGSFLSVVFPIPVAYIDFGFRDPVFWLVILVPWAMQFTLGNVVEPLIQGEGLELHPITVLLALIFWGTLWGIPGMLIAAPLTSVIRISLAKTEWGRPTANLLSGKI
jgi:AI-2 transport protein TqsA